jgi:hypothetical protein
MRLSRADRDRLRALFPAGVATRKDLLDVGLSASAITRACQAGGPWRSPVRGIIVLSDGQITPRQRARAALLRCGDPCVITGVAAARLYGIRGLPPDDRLHLLVPNERQVSGTTLFIVIRTRRMPVPVVRDGLPLAPVARALVDATVPLCEADAVRALFAGAIQRGLCTPAELAIELAQVQRPYTALARSVLEEVTDGVRSTAEAWARRLVLRSGLPAPQWNVGVRRADGRLIGVADAWWDDVGLVWEIDSREWHLDPEAHDRDTRRQSGFAAEGIPVIHTRPSRLRTERAEVLDELMRAHANASRSPRPRVRTELWRPDARRSSGSSSVA